MKSKIPARKRRTKGEQEPVADPRIEAMNVLGISNLNASRMLYLIHDPHVRQKYNLATIDEVIGYLFRIAMWERPDLRFTIQVHDEQMQVPRL